MSTNPDMKISPVVAPVREQVYQNLRQAITDMRFKPGQRLIERELVEMTGASRTSVREALRLLAADGLVKTVPHNRTLVAVPTAQEALELYQVREGLESLAVKRFVQSATDEEVNNVRKALNAYERSGGGKPGLAAKDEFYRLIGVHSPTIYELLSSLHARITLLRNISLSAPGRHAKSVEEMFSILEAIERRDTDAAAEASELHVYESQKVAIEYLTESNHRYEAVTEEDGE